jgi:hypothetical protein
MTLSDEILEALRDEQLPSFSVMAPFGGLPGIPDLAVIVESATSEQALDALRAAQLPVRSVECVAPGFIHVWFR